MSQPVKQDKQREEDSEYDEWARNRAAETPTAQIGVQQNLTGSGGTVAPTFQIQQRQGSIIPPPHSGFDKVSTYGRFTWVTIGGEKSVPCIFRNQDLYVSVRMAEISVIGELLNVVPVELYESVKLTSYHVNKAVKATLAEVKTLIFINAWHTDGFFGPDLFTTEDRVISLVDLEKFYEYLLFAFRVLHGGGKNMDGDFKHCGFMRVNSEDMIPYTVLDHNEKGVPLFYFEGGHIGILEDKAITCTGWPLAYLKVCCKVQGVRKDLISNATLQIVTLSTLKAVFPQTTIFTDKCWPPPKPKSLLPKQMLRSVIDSPLLQVTCDRWTTVENNETFPNYTASRKSPTTHSATISTVVVTNPKSGPGPVNATFSGNSAPAQMAKSA